MFRQLSAELSQYPAAKWLTLELMKRLQELNKDAIVVESAYRYAETVLLKQTVDDLLAGRLFGGRVDEAMRSRGYTQWTDADVISQVVIERLQNWSDKELDISLR